MGREGVAQRVGGNILFNVGFFLIILDDLPKALARHTLTVYIDKQGLFVGHGDHLRANHSDVFTERLYRLGIHGDKTLLIPAVASDNSRAEIDVRYIQVNQLRHPDSGCVQQFKHGSVPVPFGVDTLRLLQQKIYLFAGKDLRKFMLSFVGNQLGRWVFGNDLPEAEVGIKAFQGGYAS